MSPEYTVYVPPAQDKAFKNALSKLHGVNILNTITSRPADYDSQVSELLAGHSRLVNSILEPKNQKTERKINANFRKLITDSFGPFNMEYKFKRGVNMGTLKQVVVDIFLECTKEPPVLMQKVKGGEDKIVTWKGKPILSPAQVEALILRFGLIDGRTKSYPEIQEQLGVNVHARVEKAQEILRSRVNFSKIKPFLVEVSNIF